MSDYDFQFKLDWLSGVSLAKLSFSIDGKPVWPVAHDPSAGMEIYADDLLSFLSENWHSLLLEQTYPVLTPFRPSRLWVLLEERWERGDDSESELESIRAEEFEQRHNLGACIAGVLDPPPLWLVRQGNAVQVDNGKDLWSVSLEDLFSSLEALGGCIAHRLAAEEKFSRLVRAWGDRVKVDALTLLATSVGVSNSDAKRLVDARLLRIPSDIHDAANDDDELRLAARVTGELPFDKLKAILDIAKSVPLGDSGALDGLKGAVAENLVQSRYQKPHDVGVLVAVAAREYLGLQSAQRIDVGQVLANLRVFLRHDAGGLGDEFKGLAIWGKRHGPGIIVTPASKNGFSSAYQRVTIAHELGHLLMDGDHAIGAVDVLHGRVPLAMEQRAKSFAGEFLLPGKTAANAWLEKGSLSDRGSLKAFVEGLSKKYGVTNAVAAWKLEHGLKFWNIDLSDILNSTFPSRWR